MKRKILAIVPLLITEEETINIKKLLENHAWNNTKIDVIGLQESIAVNSYSEAEIATTEFLDLAAKAEENGYDAIISYCYLDVGVDATRELVRVPIIGPLETSAVVANMLGKKFSVISVGTTYPPGEFYILPRLKILGLDENYVSTRGISFGDLFVFSENTTQMRTMKKAIIAECKKALTDGAHVLIFGCTGFPLAKNFSNKLKVPIIDGVTTLKIAEAIIDLKLSSKKPNQSHSRNNGYRRIGSTKMRIKLLVPTSGGFNPNLLKRLKGLVNNGTRIDMIQFENGPERIESALDIAKVAPFVIKESINAEKKAYDAVVIASFEDPGLESARELCKIPIMGLGESSLLLACMLGKKFSIVTYDSNQILEKIVRKKGIERKIIDYLPIYPGVKKRKDLELNSVKVFDKIKKAVEKGAEVIILGGADVFDTVHLIRQKTKIIILDPLSIAIKMAEVFHSVGLSHSKLSYPMPVLPTYHKRRLERLKKKPVPNQFLYDEDGGGQATRI